MKKLIIIRGSPASGKTILAKQLAKKFKRKVALLILDEFKWIMTAHENRTAKDFKIAFDNYLYALKNYLKSSYTVITEDCWVKKFNDKSTDINKVILLGKKYKYKIHQILLEGEFNTIKKINKKRPMIIPLKELKFIYQKVYSKSIKGENIIIIDKKKPEQILKQALNLLI